MDPDLIGKLGLPIALVIVMVAFIGRSVWPWMTKRVEVADARTDKAMEQLSAIKEAISGSSEVNRQLVTVVQEAIKEMRRVHS